MIKELIKRIVLKEKYDSETFIKYLRKVGVKIGDNCTVFVPSKTLIDTQNPFMIKIGNNVKITEGVKILTHDFAWSVSSDIDGIVTGSVEGIEVGNNVFIGMNTIVLKGTKIGDNVIIGAGSVVTKNCESNSVYAGNPARKIMSLTEYHEKQKKQQEKRLENIINAYVEKYGEFPPKEVLREFVFLFNDINKKDEIEEQILVDSGHYKKVETALLKNQNKYKSYYKLKEKWKNE